MSNHTLVFFLAHPEGYYVVQDDSSHILCRPDGTEVWRFDPAAVLDCEITLAAFEDHSESLVMY